MANESISSSLALQDALRAARDTRHVELGSGALARVADVFLAQFGRKRAVIVADQNTMRAAGQAVSQNLSASPSIEHELYVFEDPDLYGEHSFVERLQQSFSAHDAIPIAVGSGTINDLTKLAAHRTKRPYMSVATAASMDGYTAYGASITYQGSKQTFDCPAPQAVVADSEVIRRAPEAMTAAGYADLLAKVPAGADWILSDAFGIEPMHAQAWKTVHGNLREALADPAGARRGEVKAIERLTLGLLMGGFAMQAAQSSRPGSGAEHQFSHLWDMEHHTHLGETPSHGFKVGIATLAVCRFYEYMLEQPLDQLDIEHAVSRWPSWPQREQYIRELFALKELREKALEESHAKYVEANDLRQQLQHLREIWPGLRARLKEQLMPADKIAELLQQVGAPIRSEDIGISSKRLRDSFILARLLRRRFNVLDLADRAGLLDKALQHLFPREAAA